MKRPAILMSLSLIAGILIGFKFSWEVLIIGSVFYLFALIFFNDTIYFKWLLMCLLFFFIGLVHIIVINQKAATLSENMYNDNELVVVIKSIKKYDHSTSLTCKVKELNNIKLGIYSSVYLNMTTTVDGNFQIGDVFQITGKVNEIEKPSTKGQFNSYYYYYARKIYYRIYTDKVVLISNNNWNINQLLHELRYRVADKADEIYSGNEKEIIKTMLLGLKADLNTEIKEYYKVSGISHLLAISGLHVSILAMGLTSLLSKLNKNIKVNILATIIILWCYCLMTGLSISTLRATLMISLMLLGKLTYNKYDSVSAIFICIILILTISPYQLFDVGFLLSFGAVIGIVVIGPILNKQFNNKNNEILSLIISTIAASVTTYPIISYYFYQIPLYALFVNLFVLPFIALVLYSGVIGLVVSFFSISVAVVVSSLGVFILKYVELVCMIVSDLPFNQITIGQPSIAIIILYYIVLILMCIDNKNYMLSIVESLLWVSIVAVFIISFISVNDEIVITCLDVGQGDCTVIEYEDQVFIIDSGGDVTSESETNKGQDVLLPFLYSKGYDKINGVFISHSDFDHIYGIIEIIDSLTVDFIVMPYPYIENLDTLVEILLEKIENRDISIYYFKEGDSYSFDKLNLYCLYPSVYDTTFENNNDCSNVFRLEYDEFSMLFTGDIETEGEERIVSRYDDLNVDVLKVPHHGSKTSSTEPFLQEVMPVLAVFSYGASNYFGHPSFEVVNRYEGDNIDLAHIAIEGSVEIKVNKKDYVVSYYKSKRKEIYPCKN